MKVETAIRALRSAIWRPRRSAPGRAGRPVARLGDDSGATAVEFALIAGMLFYLMAGILEFAITMLVQSSLESASNFSSRLGKTGYTVAGVTQEQTIRDSIVERAGPFIDPDKLTVKALAYGDLSQIGQPEPWNDANNNGAVDAGEFTDINGNGVYDKDMGKSGFGNGGEVVVYTVEYPWSLKTPLMDRFLGSDGIVTLSARSVVKNEPY